MRAAKRNGSEIKNIIKNIKISEVLGKFYLGKHSPRTEFERTNDLIF